MSDYFGQLGRLITRYKALLIGFTVVIVVGLVIAGSYGAY